MTELKGTLPWTKSCFVCGEANEHGLRVKSEIEDGRVTIRYTTRETDVGYKHIVHGGIAMTLLDEVMTWAAIADTKLICVAVELTTRLRKPIRVGETLRVEGWVTRATSRLCLTEGQIVDESGEFYMSAKGKYMPMPAKDAHLSEKDFVWSDDAIGPDELYLS